MTDFDQAMERYVNACAMIYFKEELKKQLPPRGSSFYRYFSDPKSNPPSYATHVKNIDDMTLEDCKKYSLFNNIKQRKFVDRI